MKALRHIIEEGETWLVGRILDYAKRYGYAAFTSTLEAPWRTSIIRLSDPMIEALKLSEDEADFEAGLATVAAPVAAFAAHEARLHRQRGVDLDYYAALLGYYRRAYLDLLDERADGASHERSASRTHFVNSFFDHIDIATRSAWGPVDLSSVAAEARAKMLELTNEKNRMLTVMESIRDPVLLLDRDGMLDYANHAALDMFSEKPKSPGDGYYSVPRLPLLRDGVAALLASAGAQQACERLVETRHGPRRFEISATPMLDLSEKFAGSVIVLHDVTAAFEAREASKRVERARTALFATITHEIRAPINAVIGISRLLADDDLEPRQREYIDAILVSGEALSTVIDDVLDYARVKTGGSLVSLAPFDLSRLVREVAGLFALRAQQGGNELAISLPGALPRRVTGDAAKLRRILTNLVENAFRHAPASRISISVRRDGDLTRISVSDTGPGVPKSLQPLLFEPFTQVHEAKGGAGLGLAIARELAEAIGGAVGCDSVEGEGATFWVEAQLPQGATHSPASAAQVSAPAPMRVLLVEDSPVDRLVAQGYLARDGHETHVAHDGAEAMGLMQCLDFDLVIMDLHLCGAGGLETIRSIRRLDDPIAASVAIVVLTSDPMAEEAGRCVGAGSDALIGKPFNPARLRSAMVDAFAQAKARRVVTASDAPIIDPAVLHAHRDRLGAEQADRIAQTFMSAVPETMKQLLRAADAGESHNVCNFAHHLRGAATFVGLHRLAATAARLEKDAAGFAPETLQREARGAATVLHRSIIQLRDAIRPIND